MAEKVKFENHHAKRVMEVFFPEGFEIQEEKDLKFLREEWTKNLKHWHSPYTCVFDARNFLIADSQRAAFERLLKFFQNFFMKKIIGFCEAGQTRTDLPFEVISGYENAIAQTGLGREGGLARDLTDLRSRIQIENDFNAHVMEISFVAETVFETAADVGTLKSKVTNILRQWHSPYSVVFNCVNCSFSTEAKAAFAPVEKFLRAFFCKEIIGYAPRDAKETYPFPTFRSRHLAIEKLAHSGIQAGDVANCSTRKKDV